jgi:hypothetical protein
VKRRIEAAVYVVMIVAGFGAALLLATCHPAVR